LHGRRTCDSKRQSLVFARHDGEINALLFQATLIVMGVATFSFVFSSFYYYCSSLGSRIDDAEQAL
jgi:hypothetical protein